MNQKLKTAIQAFIYSTVLLCAGAVIGGTVGIVISIP